MIEGAFDRLMSSIRENAKSAASKDTVEQLTEHEKFALAYVSGCPFESKSDGCAIRFFIRGPVGFAKVDGQWQVYHRRVSHV